MAWKSFPLHPPLSATCVFGQAFSVTGQVARWISEVYFVFDDTNAVEEHILTGPSCWISHNLKLGFESAPKLEQYEQMKP